MTKWGFRYNRGVKKILFVVLLLVLGSVFAFDKFSKQDKVLLSASKQTPSPIQSSTKEVATRQATSAFVPYWVLGQEELSREYDSLIYFGISPTASGIDTTEEGYKNLSRFGNLAGKASKTFLTVRMLNNDTSFTILESTASSKSVIAESIATAKEYGFEGIILDLEVNALPFDSVVNNITKFSKNFSTEAKKEELTFGMAMYGDVYYRLRPFNVKELAENVDQIYIMAYDLHKSRGNPGPNFPYAGKETYGYDFQTMIGAFLKDVPSEKLTVIFGMFGYDWEINEKGKATSSGEALSYNKIKQNFLDSCSQQKCEYAQDSQSLETKLTYIDEKDKEHIIWFETPTSVAEKKRFIKSKGISGISYWAYSYF